MKHLVLDTENTTFQKGNPFSQRNKTCAIGYLCSSELGIRKDCIPWEYSEPVSVDYLNLIKQLIDDTNLLIGFNLKYDLHWLRRYGIIDYRSLKPAVWCCQVAEFIISHQQDVYPSLERSCAKYGISGKFLDIVTDYWDKGIDTPQIPFEIIAERGTSDVDLTFQLYQKQMEYLRDKPKMLQLIRLANQDLITLAEMEWNGLRFDGNQAAEKAALIEQQMKEIDENIKQLVGQFDFNFNSVDHVSAILYGGVVRFKQAHPFERTFKSGKRAGETVIGYKHSEKLVRFPRIVEPLENTKLAKDGYWSTDKGILPRLNAKGQAKEVVNLLIRRSKMEQLASTYLRGFPKKMQEMDWVDGEIHGQLNQCVAVTGRLSASGPNMQNIPPEIDELVTSRFN